MILKYRSKLDQCDVKETRLGSIKYFLFRLTFIIIQVEITATQWYLRDSHSPPLACRAHELNASWEHSRHAQV
jgi:hypothetical protein